MKIKEIRIRKSESGSRKQTQRSRRLSGKTWPRWGTALQLEQSLFSGLFLPFLFRGSTFGFSGLGVGGNSLKSPDVLLHGCFVFLLVKVLFGDLHGLNLPFWV